MEALIINKAPTVELEKPNDTNEVQLSGTIINKYETDKVIIMTIGINESHRGKVYTHYPSVYFYKEDETGAENFLLHEKVDVLAAAVSAKKVRDNGSEYKRQGLCGIKITKAGEQFPPHKPYFNRTEKKRYNIGINRVHIEGVVRVITQLSEGIYDYSIQTMRHGKVNFIHVTQFTDTPPTIQVGSRVSTTASVCTKRKKFENHIRTFQSFVIRNIKVLQEKANDASAQSEAETQEEVASEA